MAKKSQALALYDEELAKLAQETADQEANTGGSSWISFKGGQLKIGDARMPDDRMAVVIVDHIFENAFYTTDYDPENRSVPGCYAFGKDEKEMTLHEESPEPQGDEENQCKGCPQNQWGSAPKGRGKACRNMRRIAMVQAGTIDGDGNFEPFDEETLRSQELIYARIPPTAITGFATYVKSLNTNLKKPPLGVVTQLSCEPSDDTMIAINTQLIDPVDNSWIPHLMELRKAAQQVLFKAYEKQDDNGGGGQRSKGAKQQVKGKPAARQQAGRQQPAARQVQPKKPPQRSGSRF